MLETAVGDGPKKLRLQEEVAKAGGVDADIATLLVGTAAGDGQVALLSGIAIGGGRGGGGGGSSIGGGQLLVGVVDEIFFVRHVDGMEGGLD